MSWNSSAGNIIAEGEHLGCSEKAHNQTDEELVSRDQHAVIVTYWVLMTLGALGNLAVLVSLARTRRRKSRIDLLMTHLAVADVSVTCGVIPLEIGWKYTNEWLAGNVLCKVLLVLRAFGLYLSSNVLVCISLDRFFSVLYPLKLRAARKRSQHMLWCAWALALACSLPQSVVFRVLEHPKVAGFEQCVSFGAFSSIVQEIAYNVSCLCAMYFLPLLVITVCYVCIFCRIRRCSTGLYERCVHKGAGCGLEVDSGGNKAYGNGVTSCIRLRRSDDRLLERARRRTLRMTVVIVTVFALCWLPYAIMTMWYMVDRKSASSVSPQVQDLLFAMAVSNSCMNPFVYGSYALRSNETLQKLLKKACCWSNDSTITTGNTGMTSQKKVCNIEIPAITSKLYKRSLRAVLPRRTQSLSRPRRFRRAISAKSCHKDQTDCQPTRSSMRAICGDFVDSAPACSRAKSTARACGGMTSATTAPLRSSRTPTSPAHVSKWRLNYYTQL